MTVAQPRPRTVEGDWNRLYSEYPEVYDEFARVAHEPDPLDVIAGVVPLEGARVVDVGSGSGKSTFELARWASEVIGVEPNRAMRAVAERNAADSGVTNVSFVAGSASAIPVAAASVDVVAAITASFWPAEEVVPAFVAETLRVLRPGGSVAVLETPPNWYGGELRELVAGGVPDYERAIDQLLDANGFTRRDFETVQDYGTVGDAIATYGFIFGSRAIDELRRRGQSRIRWRWRLHHRVAY